MDFFEFEVEEPRYDPVGHTNRRPRRRRWCCWLFAGFILSSLLVAGGLAHHYKVPSALSEFYIVSLEIGDLKRSASWLLSEML